MLHPGRERISVALVDPRRSLRRLTPELERYGVSVRAITPEARILRRLIGDGAVEAVAIGGSNRRVPGELAELRAGGCTVPAVVCGDSPMREEVLDAVRAGAAGFVVTERRTGPAEELAHALHAAANGGIWISPGATCHLVQEIVESAAGRSFTSLASEASVTRRERQVLELIASGMTYRDIGERLFISGSTVKTHAHSALRKLGLRNRVEVVRWISERAAAA